MEQVQGLDILEVLQKTIPTRIAEFTLHPIKMKNFKRFTTLAVPMYTDLLAIFDGHGDIVKLLEQNEAAIIELLSLSSNFTQADYDHDHFYPDDFSRLVLAMVEVNMDFFVQNLLPKVTEQSNSLINKLNQSMSKIGQRPSNV